MKKYMVVVVQAYELQTEQGQLLNSVEIALIDDSPDNALKRAKKLVKKAHYRIAKVTEFYDK